MHLLCCLSIAKWYITGNTMQHVSILGSQIEKPVDPAPDVDDWTLIEYSEGPWPSFYEVRNAEGTSHMITASSLAVYSSHSNGLTLKEVKAYGFRK